MQCPCRKPTKEELRGTVVDLVSRSDILELYLQLTGHYPSQLGVLDLLLVTSRITTLSRSPFSIVPLIVPYGRLFMWQ